MHKGQTIIRNIALCGSNEVVTRKDVKYYIKAVAKISDDHLFVVSNENIGQIYLLKEEYISLIKEVQLNCSFILPLIRKNELFCSLGNKNPSFILKFDNKFSFSKKQTINISSDFASESNDGRIFTSLKYTNDIQVLNKNSKNIYEKIYTISSDNDVYGKPFTYKDKYLIYNYETSLIINDLNNYNKIKEFEIEESFGNGEMTVFKDKFLIIIIDRGFSVYDIEKLEFIKHITTGFENVLSRSLCILKNGILLVGFSSQFIAVYDLNDDFKEIEIWKYLCDSYRTEYSRS
jgi:hypothetical protein